jgi:hypothetical protein
MAVVFRPLALLPGDAGAYVWWAIQLTALAAALIVLIRRRPLLTAAAMLVLIFPLSYEIGVGNVNSLLLLGAILTWRSFAVRADGRAGALAAAMAVVKLTPTTLAWWLVVERRWRAVAVFVVTLALLGLISLVGAGPAAHVRYLQILFDGSVTPSPLSLGDMATFLGAPATVARLLAPAAVVCGLLAIWFLRDRPALAFDAAIVTMLAGSPAVSINWYVLLLALIAPLAWPIDDAARRPRMASPTLVPTPPSLLRGEPRA